MGATTVPVCQGQLERTRALLLELAILAGKSPRILHTTTRGIQRVARTVPPATIAVGAAAAAPFAQPRLYHCWRLLVSAPWPCFPVATAWMPTRVALQKQEVRREERRLGGLPAELGHASAYPEPQRLARGGTTASTWTDAQDRVYQN